MKLPEGAAEILSQTNFTAIDWVIVIVYPMISLCIGLFVRKFIKNMNDFVCAGRGLGPCLGIATLTGTELGLITVMYNAQKGFNGGFAAFHIALVAGAVTFLVGVSGFIIGPLRRMEVLTIPEYYGKRFDRKTRILGGIMMALGGVLNMGLFLKAGSMFIVGITGMSATDWALPTVMVTLIVLVLIYTCLGGMVSVVIADYVQFVVLSFGIIIATLLAINNLQWDTIFTTVQETMGRKGFDPTVEEAGFGWSYIVWMCSAGLVACAIWPTSVARALAADSEKTVKKQFTFGSISFLIRVLIPCFWGICALVYITQHAEINALFFPSEEGVKPMDNLYGMPIFLGRILPAGIIGLITAGMIAAFMSTHDSYLLCWSSVLTQDVIAPLIGEKKLTPQRRILITRGLIVVIGLWVLYWGLVYSGKDDIWEYMNVTGGIYSSGAIALLVAGLYWKKTSSTGAFLALLMGCTAIAGLDVVQNSISLLFSQEYLQSLANVGGEGIKYAALLKDDAGVDTDQYSLKIPASWISLFAITNAIVVIVLGSLIFPDKKNPTDDATSA